MDASAGGTPSQPSVFSREEERTCPKRSGACGKRCARFPPSQGSASHRASECRKGLRAKIDHQHPARKSAMAGSPLGALTGRGRRGIALARAPIASPFVRSFAPPYADGAVFLQRTRGKFSTAGFFLAMVAAVHRYLHGQARRNWRDAVMVCASVRYGDLGRGGGLTVDQSASQSSWMPHSRAEQVAPAVTDSAPFRTVES